MAFESKEKKLDQGITQALYVPFFTHVYKK